MAFLTPPRRRRFMQSRYQLPYYEDLYGERNEDENFDRYPDVCEDEIDTDDERNMSERRPAPKRGDSHGFFARFATPKSNQQPSSGDFDHSRKGEGFFRRFASINSDSLNAKSTHNLSHLLKTTTPPTPTLKSKKLTLKRFGMFSSLNEAMDYSNTAGEALNDMLRAGALGDLEDSSATLDENVSGGEKLVPLPKKDFTFSARLSLLRDAVAKASGKLTTRTGEVDATDSNLTAQAASDGDVEDNASNTEPLKGEGRMLRPRGVAPTASLITLTPKRKNRIDKSAAPSDRRTRNQDRTKEEANRPMTRGQRKPESYAMKAAGLRANNTKKMAARAATLYRKARKKESSARRGEGRSVQAELIGERYWTGKKIKRGKPVVVVEEIDKSDVAEYVRY